MNSVSEYISSGYTLTFSKNLIIMKWQSIEEDEVVDSAQFTAFGDDAMLLSTLDLMKRKVDNKSRNRIKRSEERRCLAARKKIPNLLV